MVKIIAEIGINHNGSIEECKKMMMLAKVTGCDYAKIQKRNPDVCVPEHQKSVMRQTPWGEMTYLEYKYRMEFNEEQIKELCDFAKEIDIEFFASVWDLDSVALMAKYTKIVKLGSPVINDLELLKATRAAFDYVIMSTGMSTEEEIEKAVEACNPDVIMHTNSTYPCPEEELNLRYIEWLKTKYPTKSIGYSGHEYRLATTTAAVALGAEWVERHITMDRDTWGSDHKSSVEPAGLFSLVLDIRAVEKSRKYEPQSRIQFEGENAKKKTLRRDIK
jgi:N-acetylneuraminate synthase